MKRAEPEESAYEVQLSGDEGSFFMDIGRSGDDHVVMRFRRKPDGRMGPAEASGVGRGDIVQVIDGILVAGKELTEVSPSRPR
jgi:hypothetical protein